MRTKEFDGHSVDGKFDVAERRLDNFAVGRSEENEKGREDFGVHVGGNSICRLEAYQQAA